MFGYYDRDAKRARVKFKIIIYVIAFILSLFNKITTAYEEDRAAHYHVRSGQVEQSIRVYDSHREPPTGQIDSSQRKTVDDIRSLFDD